MQELEKILEEIKEISVDFMDSKICYLDHIEIIIKKHMCDKDSNIPTNDGWIPVEERLPEDNESDFYDAVTVTLLNGDVTHGRYRNHDKEWWIASKDGRYVWSDQVIA